MKSVLCATFLALVFSIASPGAYAKLTISGPEGPVVEGAEVTLECFSDSGTDMANYTFEKYCKMKRTWMRLEFTPFEYSFFLFGVNRSDGQLALRVYQVYKYQRGPYRCVRTDSQDGEDEVSEEITLNVIYLHNIFFPSLSSDFSEDTDILWAESGSTVKVKCMAEASQSPMYEWSQEFSDWILPSDTLELRHISEESEGKYICLARHPEMRSLVKTRAFQLRVKPKSPVPFRALELDPRTSNVVYILSFVAIPAVMLLILVFTLFAVLIRYRKRQMRKPQISLIDGEKRAPIYKGSLQSVNSTTSDTQPLVL